YLGSDALPYAILYDQFGTFIALNTLGIAIASHYSPGTDTAPESLWRKILKFPPFGALLCGLVLNFTSVPAFIDDVLQRLAATLVPVVMVAVGLQWRLRIERTEFKFVLFALIFILFIKPLFAFISLMPFDLEPLIGKT